MWSPAEAKLITSADSKAELFQSWGLSPKIHLYHYDKLSVHRTPQNTAVNRTSPERKKADGFLPAEKLICLLWKAAKLVEPIKQFVSHCCRTDTIYSPCNTFSFNLEQA